jgi:hypothetical protein
MSSGAEDVVAPGEQLRWIVVVGPLVEIRSEGVLSLRDIPAAEVQSQRIEAAGRDDVAGEVLVGERIADRARGLRDARAIPFSERLRDKFRRDLFTGGTVSGI